MTLADGSEADGPRLNEPKLTIQFAKGGLSQRDTRGREEVRGVNTIAAAS